MLLIIKNIICYFLRLISSTMNVIVIITAPPANSQPFPVSMPALIRKSQNTPRCFFMP